MNVSAISPTVTLFGENKTKSVSNTKNPISKAGEKANLVKATFLAGLGFGIRVLFELMDGDFIFEKLGDTTKKIAKKQNTKPSFIKSAGIMTGLVLMLVGGVAVLYTLFNAPKINYNGNVRAYKKQKDMDVYIKGNETERELYSQMNEKAADADKEEKEKLKSLYMQMRAAKNRVPAFVKM